ncbi:MAG: DciA family protein [Planctomycetota bacterium]|jgi:predicted nucleic acid-binding Zn ribbon protein
MDDARLQTVWQQRQFSDRFAHLSEPLSLLMKHTLAKRIKQISKLAEIWDEVVPEEISRHTALESFSRGVLSVLVDSAPHRFQLQTLLNAGLTRSIQEQFNGAINRIRLVPGQFYSFDLNGAPRYDF